MLLSSCSTRFGVLLNRIHPGGFQSTRFLDESFRKGAAELVDPEWNVRPRHFPRRDVGKPPAGSMQGHILIECDFEEGSDHADDSTDSLPHGFF